MIWWVPIVVGAASLVAVTLFLRDRLPALARNVCLALGAGLVGIGAIGLQDRASAVEWVVVPTVLAALTIFHDRLLFAGEGPGRI